MKKIAASIFTFVFIISMVCFNTNAVVSLDSRDSRVIPSQIQALVDVEDTQLFVKAYSALILDVFVNFDNIDDILSSEKAYPLYYLQQTAEGVNIYAPDYFGEYCKNPSSTKSYYCSLALQEFQTHEALSSVSPDVVIHNIYYLHGEHAVSGKSTAIYYVTNMGEYVFYHDVTNNGLLFSADAFWEYQNNLFEYFAINQPTDPSEYIYDGNGIYYNNLWDLSAYDYRSPNFNPNAPFSKMDTPSPEATPYATASVSSSADPTEHDTDSLLLLGGVSTGIVLLIGVTVLFILKKERTAAK